MERIKVTVGDQVVIGEIQHRTPNDIEVMLIHPFKGNIRAGSSIPTFARRAKTFNGEYGIHVAEQLTRRIFGYYSAIHSDELATQLAWNNYFALANPLSMEIRSLENEQKQLRVLFRQSQLSQTAYQSALRATREKIFERTENLELLFDCLLQPLFPVPVPYGTRSDILKYLDQRFGAK